MSTRHETRSQATRDGRSVARAWVSLAVVPPFFILAMAAGQGIYALLGYKPENADAPFWVSLLAGGPALLLLLAPCVTAVFYGWRANRMGDRRALAPLVIAALIGFWFTVLTVVGLFAGPA
jgi:hypothetical protein